MSAHPATTTTRRDPTRSALLVVADPHAAPEAADLLRAAQFTVEEQSGNEARVSTDARVVILVLTGEATDRVEAIRARAEQLQGAAFVATMPADAPAGLLRRALRAGADGIVFDEELRRTLVATVRAVAAGQLALPRTLRRQIAPRPLSYREKEILSLVVMGYTNRQIADKLFLAQSTVKTHLSSAFQKLDARSRAEAAALVLDPDSGYGLGLPVFSTAPPA